MKKHFHCASFRYDAACYPNKGKPHSHKFGRCARGALQPHPAIFDYGTEFIVCDLEEVTCKKCLAIVQQETREALS